MDNGLTTITIYLVLTTIYHHKQFIHINQTRQNRAAEGQSAGSKAMRFLHGAHHRSLPGLHWPLAQWKNHRKTMEKRWRTMETYEKTMEKRWKTMESYEKRMENDGKLCKTRDNWKAKSNCLSFLEGFMLVFNGYGETMNVLQQVFDKNCMKKTFTRESQCRFFNHCRGNHLANSKHLG